MDPNLFHLDWERTFEVLATLVVLAFLLERALAPLFENRCWLRRFDDQVSKELIAFIVALVACLRWRSGEEKRIRTGGQDAPDSRARLTESSGGPRQRPG